MALKTSKEKEWEKELQEIYGHYLASKESGHECEENCWDGFCGECLEKRFHYLTMWQLKEIL